MTAPDARQPGELREAIADVIAEKATGQHWSTAVTTAYSLADALLPVVTAWADRQARERAAEELEALAQRFARLGQYGAGILTRNHAAALSAAGQPRPDDDGQP